jgi:dienelactone hydrolase
VAALCSLLFAAQAFGYSFRTEIPLPRGGTLPAFCFLPNCGARLPLPGVLVGVGVGSTKILQYHDHCQHLADRNFFVVLIDPSNFPESMVPGPYTWHEGAGYLWGSVNQGVVAGRLLFTQKWYLENMRAAVDFLWCSPLVDKTRIVLSGFSQPANAALTYASSDPRVKAVVWNYGGSPWIMPYNPLGLPPVLIFHGEEDEVYDVKYAKELAWELRTNGRDYEAYLYPHQKHMFNVYYDLRTENRYVKPVLLDAFERMISFLYRKLRIPPAPASAKRRSRPVRSLLGSTNH